MPTSDQLDIGRLLIACPDRPGIVAAVSQLLRDHGATIVHSDQHSTDPVAGVFFMRLEFRLASLEDRLAELQSAFAATATAFAMEWQLTLAARRKRLAIFVSRAEHALFELLWRHRAGDLPADISLVISNHPDLESAVATWGVPFYYTPVDRAARAAAEHEQLRLLDGRVDTVVLARYMQVLSPRFVAAYPHGIINIHHSFLPAFVGANPYQRAYDRGVKLIGATAHYVTEDLDAGPIIDQDVQRVDHRHTVDDLRRMGRYVERLVLARAVSWHVEDRILVHGNKTVVFS